MTQESRAKVSANDAAQLLAKHLGVNLDLLQEAEAKRQEAEAEAKRQAQAAAEQARRDQQDEKIRSRFFDELKDGAVILFIDGRQIKTTSGFTCRGGVFDAAATNTIYQRYNSGKRHLSGPAYIDGHPGIFKAAEFSQDVPCSCGEVHKFRGFVSRFGSDGRVR